VVTTQHFDRSLLPPARAFYEGELGELRRASRSWSRPKTGCPFHESSSKASFAVNLDSGGFFCFSCGARGGDVLEFVRLRYRLSFPDALKRLHIESSYQPKPKKKTPPKSLDQMLARKLALAVEYGTEMPPDAR
jgi:DNA primase